VARPCAECGEEDAGVSLEAAEDGRSTEAEAVVLALTSDKVSLSTSPGAFAALTVATNRGRNFAEIHNIYHLLEFVCCDSRLRGAAGATPPRRSGLGVEAEWSGP